MSFDAFAIQAENLGKTYDLYDRPIHRLLHSLFPRRFRGREFVALQGVSFTLKRGEVLGVIGNNGAGKSTLLQLICGTLKPSSGSLQVKGRIAALLELGAGFNPEFTGRENIFLSGAIFGLSQAEIEAKYDEIVAFSGVEAFIDQPVKTYSSGMFVRLAFAIATSVNPEILVIDEALSVGDGAFARKSFDRIMAMREAGATILFCSHSMYHIESICDRALWLERGQVRLLGRPGEVTRCYMGDQLSASAAPETAQPAPTVLADQARILNIEASSGAQRGNRLSLRSRQDELRVQVDFCFDEGLPLPSVSFGLETTAGVAISSGGTLFDQVLPIKTSPGRATATLHFPNLPLMKGEYRLTIFLGCERAIHLYDQALYCVDIKMEHEGNEQGLCFLPHHWNDEPQAPRP
ncbi:ABC transporter ATP-binding protein [Azovibrio restrictus]|uniref:ABC transporter ATP-binding protein n=1 Tax=Azovibrio restrictus TaxID=146938 RepID=UPI0026EB632D|nr:ABC transporter ATP-binding protein [Azovibrio restrictus]MDD3483266.1 ABC transporter ATP-binding protein [Azovibrio restrictus]